MTRLCKLSLYANDACDDLVVYFRDNWNDALLIKLWSRFAEKRFLLLGFPFQDTPSYNFGFRSSVQKNGLPGEERHWGLVPRNDVRNGFIPFFLTLPLPRIFCVPCLRPSEGVANQEGFLRCSKRFDHRSHFISFLLFEFKSIDDVGARKLREMLMLHTNPDLPRTQTSLLRAQSKAGRRLRASLAVCTLPMVSYGSSPPCEKRSAWGGGWAQTPFTVGSRLLEMTVGVSFGASGSFCEHVPNLITV